MITTALMYSKFGAGLRLLRFSAKYHKKSEISEQGYTCSEIRCCAYLKLLKCYVTMICHSDNPLLPSEVFPPAQ